MILWFRSMWHFVSHIVISKEGKMIILYFSSFLHADDFKDKSMSWKKAKEKLEEKKIKLKECFLTFFIKYILSSLLENLIKDNNDFLIQQLNANMSNQIDKLAKEMFE